jgi:hypothetical protein
MFVRVSGRNGQGNTKDLWFRVSSLLVPQANVFWFEHLLISSFVAKDEVKSMHSLHHSPAGNRQRALSHAHIHLKC